MKVLLPSCLLAGLLAVVSMGAQNDVQETPVVLEVTVNTAGEAVQLMERLEGFTAQIHITVRKPRKVAFPETDFAQLVEKERFEEQQRWKRVEQLMTKQQWPKLAEFRRARVLAETKGDLQDVRSLMYEFYGLKREDSPFYSPSLMDWAYVQRLGAVITFENGRKLPFK